MSMNFEENLTSYLLTLNCDIFLIYLGFMKSKIISFSVDKITIRNFNHLQTCKQDKRIYQHSYSYQ